MKTLIAIPCLDMVDTDFMTSVIGLDKPDDCQYMVTKNSLIYDARNRMAWLAVDKGFEAVLWLDSDMKFEPDLLVKMTNALQECGRDYVSALCFTRSIPMAPVIYRQMKYKPNGETEYQKCIDYPKDKLFKIAASGLGATITTTKLLSKVIETFGHPFQPLPYLGEDLSFCHRVQQLGFDMWCDSRIKVGHLGTINFNEQLYLGNMG